MRGRQFMCSYNDGSLRTWNIKYPSKPESIMVPHAKTAKDKSPELCHAITKVDWRTARGSDSFIAFAGGMSVEKGNQNPCVTVIHGKTTTVLEMEHSIIDFITLCETPWLSDYQDPYAIVVLLYNDLVVIDLTSSGYPCYQNPYPMDLHESPVTSCSYFADCPDDLIPALYSTGTKGKKKSDWPIDGGGWGISTQSYPEVIITGHADGSLKFWDASSVSLQILYKLKISRIFEKPKVLSSGVHEDDPFAIEHVSFSPESVLEIPVFYETDDDLDNQDTDIGTTFQPTKSENQNSSNLDGAKLHCGYVPTKVKPGVLKKSPGFQAELVCLAPVINKDTPLHITALTINTTIGLMAYGSECGLAIIDIIQKCCVASMNTPDLYGSSDPYQRVPRSPKRGTMLLGDNPPDSDKSRSSAVDQVNGMCLSPTTRKHLLQKKPPSAEMRRTKSQDKIDSSFARSRSSSMSSLENIVSEAVQCLVFADSYCRKSDFVTSPTLWVGTNLGSVLIILLTISSIDDERYTQPVIISPSGTVYRLKGSILSISFLDSTGTIISSNFETWKSDPKNNDRERKKLSSNNHSKSKVSPTSDSHDSHLVLMCSEKQALIVTVPSQSYDESSPSPALFKEGEGGLSKFLKAQQKRFPSTTLFHIIARTFCFSKNGHGVYLCSPTELQKFSISADYCNALQDMLGTLFVNKEIPEAPKQSFLKVSLVQPQVYLTKKNCVFGISSGKPSKNVASHVHISSNTEQIKGQTGTLGGELAKVKQVK
ncbi:syntaxin-binding protein 5 [Caerostris extrusa]|uniref:Syntaxin-binding protein 5 n=1 Tax=Caerostris extrusa TaxID=172846 RepID=A0AAV4UZV1_CAEEX|nr:syntaxin-binding protein 5 [Caerostris extrusa]